jgi:hypothetical protein
MFLIPKDEWGWPEDFFSGVSEGTPQERWARIVAIVGSGGQAEFLHLDFKTATPDHVGRGDEHVKGEYARMVSAFSNADGGVVVWGVDCPDDVAKRVPGGPKIIGVRGAAAFANWLNITRKEVVTPAAPDIRSCALEDPTGKGQDLVVTYVAKSWMAPHMAHMGDTHRYYRRGSDMTRKMDAYEVEEMLGRRAGPLLQPTVVVKREMAAQAKNERGAGRWPDLVIVWDLRNRGRGMAHSVCLEIRARLYVGGKKVNAHEYGLDVKQVPGTQRPDYVRLGGSVPAEEGHYVCDYYIPPDGPPIRPGGHTKIATTCFVLDAVRRQALKAAENLSHMQVEATLEWVASAQDMKPQMGGIALQLPPAPERQDEAFQDETKVFRIEGEALKTKYYSLLDGGLLKEDSYP